MAIFSTIMRQCALGMITLYQWCVSPWLGSCCRFTPTCSEYTKEAIMHYGLMKGVKRGILRIIRCRPGCQWGYDPVEGDRKPSSGCCDKS